jgi:hypothetical protein
LSLKGLFKPFIWNILFIPKCRNRIRAGNTVSMTTNG